MMESRKLWYERLQHFLNLFLRYMRLIANSGLLFSIIFLVIFGSYYYSLLLRQIPDQFPVLAIIAVIMTLVLTKANLRTFLKQADIVYLLPAEERMKDYFSSALLYNILIQVTVTIVIAIILAPLYAIRMDVSMYSYSMIIVLFALVKMWNVIVHWYAFKLNSERAILSDTLLRVFATFSLVYLTLTGADVLYLVFVSFIMLAFLVYVAKIISRNHRVKWERLLQHEEMLATRFYKFVNAFVDVPMLTQRVKPRRWTKIFASFNRYEKSSVPKMLYTHAFFRSGQYFGIYVRLLIIGIIVLAYLPYEYGKIFGMILFLYMTAVQLIPLARHYLGHDVVKLYPIERKLYVQAFGRLVFTLLTLQSLLYSATIYVSGIPITISIALFLGSVLAIYIYLNQIIKKEVRNEQ